MRNTLPFSGDGYSPHCFFRDSLSEDSYILPVIWFFRPVFVVISDSIIMEENSNMLDISFDETKVNLGPATTTVDRISQMMVAISIDDQIDPISVEMIMFESKIIEMNVTIPGVDEYELLKINTAEQMIQNQNKIVTLGNKKVRLSDILPYSADRFISDYAWMQLDELRKEMEHN